MAHESDTDRIKRKLLVVHSYSEPNAIFPAAILLNLSSFTVELVAWLYVGNVCKALNNRW